MNFFDEIERIRCKVPRPALHNMNCENAEYGNFCLDNKSCYMVFATDFCEDCYYSRWLIKGKNNIDCTNSHELELCYECLNCRNCYSGSYLQDCENCTNCSFCFDCMGCNDCFGCAGLRHSQYYIFNKKYSAKDYKKKIQELTVQKQEYIKTQLEALKKTTPCLYGRLKNNENVIGDYVYNCKNCFCCFEIKESEDSAYLNEGFEAFNTYDSGFFGEVTDCYECMVAYRQNNCNFCWYCFNSSNLEYCEYCLDCHDCFGCIGLKKKQYHILNKSYEKEEYFKEITRIKEKLKLENTYNKKFLESTYQFKDTLAADR